MKVKAYRVKGTVEYEGIVYATERRKVPHMVRGGYNMQLSNENMSLSHYRVGVDSVEIITELKAPKPRRS